MADPAAAFLRDIIAEPDSDDLRLIFADYLQEHGDEARAEFIRVQVELAKRETETCYYHGKPWPNSPPARCCCLGNSDFLLPGEPDTGCQKCRAIEALRRRERELLRHHRWFHGKFSTAITAGYYAEDRPIYKLFPPGGGPEIANVTFRRGFVDMVHLTLADWMGRECPHLHEWASGHGHNLPGACALCRGTGRTGGHGPALVKAAPLERVTLSDVQPADSGEGNEDIGGRWFWVVDDGARGHRRHVLPSKIAAFLPKHPYPHARNLLKNYVVRYQTRQAALDALSDALLDSARGA